MLSMSLGLISLSGSAGPTPPYACVATGTLSITTSGPAPDEMELVPRIRIRGA